MYIETIDSWICYVLPFASHFLPQNQIFNRYIINGAFTNRKRIKHWKEQKEIGKGEDQK